MKKHYQKFFALALSALLLSGCTMGKNESSSVSSLPEGLQAWLDSDEAQDLNGDRKIYLDDYNLYVAFKAWKKSADAYDCNGDKKIDYSDYEVYLGYVSWMDSEAKKDWNDDKKINIEDYLVYLANEEFTGNYKIKNYVYIGDAFTIFDSDVSVGDVYQYLEPLTITIHKSDYFTVSGISAAAYTAFGSSTQLILEVVDNAYIKRLSKVSVVVDSSVVYAGVNMNLSVYLVPTTTGFSTSYKIQSGTYTGTFTCDIEKQAA